MFIVETIETCIFKYIKNIYINISRNISYLLLNEYETRKCRKLTVEEQFVNRSCQNVAEISSF